MRIQLLSDLHFEFHADGGASFVESLAPEGIDVLVLAGDIAVGEGIGPALALFCERYRSASVLYVHGNHEYYGSDRASVRAITEAAVRAHENLVWLDTETAEIGGRRFIGTTLWFPPHPSTARLKRSMADFSEIRGFEEWVTDANAQALALLRAELREGDIVVSHHLPSRRSVAPRYSGHPLNPFFVCDVEDLILERRPALWMHGHTHNSVRTTLGATLLVCNPFGYVGYELNRDFDDGLFIDI